MPLFQREECFWHTFMLAEARETKKENLLRIVLGAKYVQKTHGTISFREPC